VGRWSSVDPNSLSLGTADSHPSLYGYVANSPSFLVDPAGLDNVEPMILQMTSHVAPSPAPPEVPPSPALPPAPERPPIERILAVEAIVVNIAWRRIRPALAQAVIPRPHTSAPAPQASRIVTGEPANVVYSSPRPVSFGYQGVFQASSGHVIMMIPVVRGVWQPPLPVSESTRGQPPGRSLYSIGYYGGAAYGETITFRVYALNEIGQWVYINSIRQQF
jgi:hypothetical protein